MRRTYAYNGITLGALAGLAVGITTNNWGIGIATAVVGSIVCFAGIRALENLIDKGVRDCALIVPIPCNDELQNTIFTIEQMAINSGFRVVVNHVTDDTDPSNEFCEVYIYKYNYQRIIINIILEDKKIDRFLKEYLLGTLLGYSAQSMEEYIMKNVTLELIGKEE